MPSFNLMQRAKKSLENRLKRTMDLICYNHLNLEWKIQSGLPIKIRSSAEWAVYNDIFVDREYDIAIEEALNFSTNQETFNLLDLGANVGFFLFKFASLMAEYPGLTCKIIAVEGSPKNYNDLMSRVKEAKLQLLFPHLQVQLVHGLVGQTEGEGFIEEFDFHVMSAVNLNPSKRAIKVPYIDLKKFYTNDATIDLLKCDIEGSELSFLRNYENLLLRTNFAVFEIHHNSCNINECIEILRSCGLEHKKTLKTGKDFSLEYFARSSTI